MVLVNPGEEILASHINAKMDADGSNVLPGASFIPDSNNAYDIGSSGVRWKDVFIVSASISGSAVVGTTLQVFGKVTAEANVEVKGQGYSPTATLIDGANIATDCDTANVFEVTLAGSRILDNPTNQQNGATYLWTIKQSAGSHTLSYGTAFKFPGGTAPVLSLGAGAVDIMSGVSDGTNIYCNMLNDMQ